MCSRFELKADDATIKTRFGLNDLVRPNKTEVRPTDLAMILAQDRVWLQPWGLKPAWDGPPLINARAETVDQKPSFKPHIQRRILVPASHWWEWTRDARDRPGQKMVLKPQAATLFSFAGITDGERFTVITCVAVASMSSLNDRMPVILAPEQESLWLDGALGFETVRPCLAPYGGELLIEADPDPTPQLSLF